MTLVFRPASAFTLVELLVVISIIGILAGLTVPVIKHFGKSDATISASRQLLDDVGRARQLAMSQRTTVYMVFVPGSFWNDASGNFNNSWWDTLTFAEKVAATNLCGNQFTGYTFVSLRTMGDQPGQGVPRYLTRWQTLPEGMFIATNKFAQPGTLLSSFSDPLYLEWNQDPNYNHPDQNKVYAFTNVAPVPFPTETSTRMNLPCIAFNYLGQLTFDGLNLADRDEYIPLARGSVFYAADQSKALQLRPPDAQEIPPGNSTNAAYGIIHIGRLTGRATLEYMKVK